MPKLMDQPEAVRYATGGKITLRYVKDDDYRLHFANGVWGGVTPQGFLRMDFWQDIGPSNPEAETYAIEDGRLGELVERSGDPVPQRLVVAGIVVPLDQAERLSKWLTSKLEEQAQLSREVQEAKDTEEA